MSILCPIVIEKEQSGAVSGVSPRQGSTVDIVGVAALVGARRSSLKARASRANGRLGGRPRKKAT